MQRVNWDTLNGEQQSQLLRRPALANNQTQQQQVAEIIAQVRSGGDSALRSLTAQIDKTELEQLTVAVDAPAKNPALSPELKAAIDQAWQNIRLFHQQQQPQSISIETQPGVRCEQHFEAFDTVGLYIPGGTAPLISTVLMLGVPAQIAACRQLVLCTPPDSRYPDYIHPAIRYAASLCGVNTLVAVGGAQAVAALAYGTESVPKADKIFGPGNSWVTEAKRQVSLDVDGAAIDMPAGPSEVLVIADAEANPAYIAADLLSQAEHGSDSQVILLATCDQLLTQVERELKSQLAVLPRCEIASQALACSALIKVGSLDQACELSNRYAPEHLIVQTEQPRQLLPKLRSAGSIFLGAWTPESVGDYASGTNHVLPTYGYSRTVSSLGLADFGRRYTVQELTRSGLEQLADSVTTLAAAEGLDAHLRAVTVRLEPAAQPAQSQPGTAGSEQETV